MTSRGPACPHDRLHRETVVAQALGHFLEVCLGLPVFPGEGFLYKPHDGVVIRQHGRFDRTQQQDRSTERWARVDGVRQCRLGKGGAIQGSQAMTLAPVPVPAWRPHLWDAPAEPGQGCEPTPVRPPNRRSSVPGPSGRGCTSPPGLRRAGRSPAGWTLRHHRRARPPRRSGPARTTRSPGPTGTPRPPPQPGTAPQSDLRPGRPKRWPARIRITWALHGLRQRRGHRERPFAER